MHESCGCRITAITPAFQAGDVGSTPIIRFRSRFGGLNRTASFHTVIFKFLKIPIFRNRTVLHRVN